MARISLPTGYTAEARAYAPPARFRCALIEYVSASCRYCSTEQGGGATLARKLAAAGCVVITLAPSRAELRPAAEGASEVQLVYLAPNWLATVPRLQLVPTMILVGGDGRVAWFKVGELTQTDVAAALSVLEER